MRSLTNEEQLQLPKVPPAVDAVKFLTEVLVLKMNGCDIRVPTLVSLPYLIVLELSGITFTCYAEKLILTLPVLKKCKAQNCCWLNVKGITFEVPLLETLFIKYAHTSKSEMSHTVIKFCAPCLSEFACSSDYKLGDTIWLDLDLSTARIANANIHLLKLGEENNEGEESMSLFACAVLKQFINNVECLKFVVSKNAYGDHLFHIGVPALTDIYDFGTLSCLEIGEVTGEVLLDFLCKSPFLKTLVIFKLEGCVLARVRAVIYVSYCFLNLIVYALVQLCNAHDLENLGPKCCTMGKPYKNSLDCSTMLTQQVAGGGTVPTCSTPVTGAALT
ncbi:hypothetical protein Fmac_018870 [Flemingia macrophylla]|uniref:FBD domain-containing protein n=1 Tax=Flemingia macrophylla TaxID=520843 RepID=A0ABD1M673_9FABA